MRPETISRYLLAIFRLAETYDFEPISVSGLWGTRSHSDAIRELVARGLIVHATTQGVALTPEGKRRAIEIRERTAKVS